MGYFKHNAIIVTAWCHDTAVEAQDKAVEIFHAEMVSEIIKSPYNGFESFFIVPDGSKEGRDGSEIYNEFREFYIKWIEAYDQDCSNGPDKIPVSYVEVSFGGDDNRAEIINTNHD